MSKLRIKPMSPLLAWSYLSVIIGITAALLYEPFQSTRSKQLQELSKLEEVISKQRTLIGQSENISITLQKERTKRSKINTIMKAGGEPASGNLQSIIRELTVKSGVALTRIQALPSRPISGISILTTKVDGFASLIDLHSFLLKLSKNRPALRVNSVDLVPVGNDNGSTKLNFSFKISVLADHVQ